MKKLIQSLLVFSTLLLGDSIYAQNLEEQPVLNVIVGTEGVMKPFTYYDHKNNLTGFDVDVIKEIGKIDPNLNFIFKTATWDALFPGLDAGHYQVLANQIAYNEHRAKNYLLTDEVYFQGATQPITLADRATEFQKIEDLKGKKVAVGVGSNHSLVLEDWNQKNGNEIKIVYYDGDVGVMFQELINYRVDAIMNSPVTALEQAKANNIEISPIGQPFYDAKIHLILAKSPDSEVIKTRLDAALRQLHKNGTLSKLSIQYFDQDLTK